MNGVRRIEKVVSTQHLIISIYEKQVAFVG
jgi:hypothetical protein